MLKLLYFLVILLGLIFRKSKIVRGIQIAAMWVIFALNSWNEDDISYRRIYSGYYGKGHEMGFDWLCSFCRSLGMPYATFRLAFISISLILFLYAIKKLFPKTGNDGYSLLLVYPLLAFVELLRNFSSWAVVLCGIAWYFQREKKGIKEKIVYSLIVIFASLFHYSALFFLVLLLDSGSRPNRESYVKVALLSIGSIVLLNLPIISRIVRIVFHSDKVSAWFSSSGRIGIGIVIIITFHIIQFVIYDQYYRNYFNHGDIENNEKLGMLYSMNIFSFALMGFYTYNFEFFSRIYTLLMAIDILHISEMAGTSNDETFVIKGTRNELMLMFSQLAFQILLAVFFLKPFSQDGIMSMILNNNYLFK